MNKIHLFAALITLITLGSCNTTDKDIEFPSPDLPESSVPAEEIKGELLIKFKPEMSELLDRSMQRRSRGASKGRFGIPSTDEVLEILGAYDFERVFPVDPQTEERTRAAGMHLWYLVRFDENTNMREATDKLSQLGEISKIQYNRTIQRSYDNKKKPYLVAESAHNYGASQFGSFPFDDPGLYRQWGYINRTGYPFEKAWAKTIAGSDVNCEEAWQYSTGDPSIIVAVLDEGVMWNHPDLEANMWINESEKLFSENDADGNGYIGDRYGYNFVTNSGIISWASNYDVGHGTHVAGTIAAVNGNGEGVCGIAGGAPGKPGVKIMSCQLFDGQYAATLAMEAKAIKYAADNGAVILQCSWGYNSALSNMLMYNPGPASEKEWEKLYPLEKEALDYFIKNAGSPNGVIQGGLAIFASGNEYSAMSAFPAAYSGCIAVSSISADFTPSSFSNFGAEVDLAAPGGDTDYYGTPGELENPNDMQGSIYSTLVIDGQPGYGYMDGTSMACPAAAGVAALGLSYAAELRRHFTATEFRQLLISSANDLNQYYSGEKLYYYNHNSGGSPATRMDLSLYRGKMGKLANAGALLRAVAANGSEMKVPNIYVAPNKTVNLDLSKYFLKGETLTYTCTVADATVAAISITGSKLSVSGLKTAYTTATISTSNGKKQIISITVRENAGNNGWM